MSQLGLVWNALRSIRKVAGHAGGLKLAAAAGGAALTLVIAVGAGAAPSPFSPVSEVLGLNGEHGAAVSDAVQQAKETVEDGNQIGVAVSEAACEAAHDRSTLPDGAQNAPGRQGDGPEKDCTHPADVQDESQSTDVLADSTVESSTDLLEADSQPDNHGAAVSQAVHDAKAALEEGEKVGPAVSEAACEAAHDRSTLPDGAQNAPGQQGDGPEKDCTHPSNKDSSADAPAGSSDSSSAGDSNAHGKASAPGQLKKQSD
jgi:hypothetical protein